MPKNVKNTTFPGLFDLLAPHSCRGCGRIGAPLCERCKKYIISEHSTYQPDLPKEFITQNTPSQPNFSAASIDLSLNNSQEASTKHTSANHLVEDPPIQHPTFILAPRTSVVGTMIHDLKYHSARALAKSLAELLDETLPEFRGKVSIVPLPTNSKHIRLRGLDHTLLIAKHLARLRDYKVEKLLVRAKNTTQVGATEAARRHQASLAYDISPNATLDPKTTYLLLDDVWTTGSSIQAALKKFLTLRPKKYHLVLLARN